MTNKLSNSSLQLLTLIRAALWRRNVPKTFLQEFESASVLRLAKNHSLAALASYALLPLLEQVNSPEASDWKRVQTASLTRSALFLHEQQNILDALESLHIKHLPFKGFDLAELWPTPAAREFCDCDIYFDKSRRQEVHDLFAERGYILHDNESTVDAYSKPPFSFEMHLRMFFLSGEHKALSMFFEHPFELAYPVNDRKYQYHFTPEANYIYLLAHAFKHNRWGGVGLRFLVDLWCYRQAYAKALDYSYVNESLAQLGLTDFERTMVSLTSSCFGDGSSLLGTGIESEHLDLSPQESELLTNIIQAGTYGTHEQRYKAWLHENTPDAISTTATRVRYILSRAFPGREWFKYSQPALYKYPVLIPGYWLYRVVVKGTKKLPHVASEIRSVFGEHNE